MCSLPIQDITSNPDIFDSITNLPPPPLHNLTRPKSSTISLPTIITAKYAPKQQQIGIAYETAV